MAELSPLEKKTLIKTKIKSRLSDLIFDSIEQEDPALGERIEELKQEWVFDRVLKEYDPAGDIGDQLTELDEQLARDLLPELERQLKRLKRL